MNFINSQFSSFNQWTTGIFLYEMRLNKRSKGVILRESSNPKSNWGIGIFFLLLLLTNQLMPLVLSFFFVVILKKKKKNYGSCINYFFMVEILNLFLIEFIWKWLNTYSHKGWFNWKRTDTTGGYLMFIYLFLNLALHVKLNMYDK